MTNTDQSLSPKPAPNKVAAIGCGVIILAIAGVMLVAYVGDILGGGVVRTSSLADAASAAAGPIAQCDQAASSFAQSIGKVGMAQSAQLAELAQPQCQQTVESLAKIQPAQNIAPNDAAAITQALKICSDAYTAKAQLLGEYAKLTTGGSMDNATLAAALRTMGDQVVACGLAFGH